MRVKGLLRKQLDGHFAHVAQSVEHVLGKDGVTGSNPVVGSANDERGGMIGQLKIRRI